MTDLTLFTVTLPALIKVVLAVALVAAVGTIVMWLWRKVASS